MAQVKDLLGLTLISVEVNKENDEILFKTDSGRTFKMYHSQDCCENVSIEDINGDLTDLIGNPLTLSEEYDNEEYINNRVVPEYEESFTYTFYRFATIKGYVDIRWYGSSNGYYSESVSFIEVGVDNEW